MVFFNVFCQVSFYSTCMIAIITNKRFFACMCPDMSFNFICFFLYWITEWTSILPFVQLYRIVLQENWDSLFRNQRFLQKIRPILKHSIGTFNQAQNLFVLKSRLLSCLFFQIFYYCQRMHKSLDKVLNIKIYYLYRWCLVMCVVKFPFTADA